MLYRTFIAVLSRSPRVRPRRRCAELAATSQFARFPLRQ